MEGGLMPFGYVRGGLVQFGAVQCGWCGLMRGGSVFQWDAQLNERYPVEGEGRRVADVKGSVALG